MATALLWVISLSVSRSGCLSAYALLASATERPLQCARRKRLNGNWNHTSISVQAGWLAEAAHEAETTNQRAPRSSQLARSVPKRAERQLQRLFMLRTTTA